MTLDQFRLLKELSLHECVISEGDDITALCDKGFAYVWDMWSDGRRRWAITSEGRAVLTSGKGENPVADIAKRLRDWLDYEPVKMFGAVILKDIGAAADEIERLRLLAATLQRQRDALSDMLWRNIDPMLLSPEFSTVVKEISRSEGREAVKPRGQT